VKGPGGGVIAALSVVLPRDFDDTDAAVILLKTAAVGITRAMRTAQILSH
jgi:hypothetical protein